jgi:hypothetical protein
MAEPPASNNELELLAKILFYVNSFNICHTPSLYTLIGNGGGLLIWIATIVFISYPVALLDHLHYRGVGMEETWRA